MWYDGLIHFSKVYLQWPRVEYKVTTVYPLDTCVNRVRDTNRALRCKYGRIRWPSTSGLPFWSQHSLPASGGATVNCKPQGQNSFKSMPFAITRADQNVIDKRRVSNGPSWVTQGRAGRGGIGGLPWAGHVQSVLWVCCVLDETCQKCHGKCSNANADGDADDDDDDDEVTYN